MSTVHPPLAAPGYAALEPAAAAPGRPWVAVLAAVVLLGCLALGVAGLRSPAAPKGPGAGGTSGLPLQSEPATSAPRTWALVPVVGSAPAWRIVNDNVMGGRSTSRVEAATEGIVFSGTIDTNGGGFASCRRQLPQGLARASGVTVTARKVSGGSTRYKLLLKSKGFDVPSWQSDFTLRADGQSSTVHIPFSRFLPSFRGRVVGPPGVPKAEIPKLSEVGVMLSFLTDGGERDQSGFTAGPFGILLQELLAFE